MEDRVMSALIEGLAAELGDRDIAAGVVREVIEVGFSWTPPKRAPEATDLIVAYAFGNRPRAGPPAPPNAPLLERLDSPGPVNEQIADAVFALHRLKPAPVIVQWEIAHYLRGKYGLSDVVSIEPVLSATGDVVYLSTEGVARAAVEATGGDAKAMGSVAVVAHRDHAKRCVQISRSAGMSAFAPEGIDLPVAYDPLSGQPWTRRRDIYLLHDMVAQLAARRTAVIEGA